jgi:transcriptional regulator with GAF, ATPase, and Fis domain
LIIVIRTYIRTVEEQQNGAPPEMHRMRFPDDHGVAGWVLREKRSVMIHDVSKDTRFGAHLDIQKGFVTRSMICVPLMTRNEIIGVLYATESVFGERPSAVSSVNPLAARSRVFMSGGRSTLVGQKDTGHHQKRP